MGFSNSIVFNISNSQAKKMQNKALIFFHILYIRAVY